MNKTIIYRLSLWIGISASLIGFYLKFTNYFIAGSLILSVGIICTLIIMAFGLIDMFANKKLKQTEKIMWFVGFIFITLITGIVYFPTFKTRN